MRLSSLTCVCLALALDAGAQSLAPPNWDAGVRLGQLVDRNPDPHVVEVDLTARIAEVEIAPGLRVKAWTYDGGLPGPLIRATVGDRVIVHFVNQLPKPTTVHWHGVRVPIEMDGVPGVSQPEVQPGDPFTYDFVVRDAGLFWYHPHVMSAAQVGFGLYGPLLVDDPADAVNVPDETTIVLSDIGFDKSGVPDDPESGGIAGMFFGREGDYLLVNGRVRPGLLARAGAPQRWRIVNAAKSRFFYLDLDGQKFHVIGSDGGLQERPVDADLLLVTPGERVDVIVTPTGKPGSTLTLRAMLYNRGYGSIEYRKVEDIMSVQLSPDPAVVGVKLPLTSRTIAVPARDSATPVNLTVTLNQLQNRLSEFRVNGSPFWEAKPFTAGVGETQVWTVKNESEWDHPFHLHGFFFLVLDEKGEPVHPLAWKDTVNIEMKSTRRLLVRFDERPGEWMFHCHILDHADGGLMGTVLVGDVAPSAHVHVKGKP